MKNNKSKKFFIIIIILLAIILVVGAALAMFSSNKSDKELFFEYLSQVFDEEKGFIDNKLGQYSEKKKTSSYENQGSFSANVNSDEQTAENINNVSITFDGNTDSANSASEQLIKINYSDQVNFPIQYKKVNGIYGIKFSDISKKYFSVPEDEISGLIAKLMGNDSTVYSKANEASLREQVAAAKDKIALEVDGILMNYYDDKYVNNAGNNSTSNNASLKETILSQKYESNGVTITNDKTEGTITITSNTNPGYNVTATISETGRVTWGEISTVNLESNESFTSSINTIDISSFNFTKEEKDKLKDTYLPAIKDVFDDSSFTRVTTMESEGYTLQLSNEKFKEVIIKILETLKNDEQMLDKLSSIFGTSVSPTNIDSAISNLQSEEIAEGNSIITVYQNEKKLNKIEIQFNDQIKLTISKTSDDDTVSYQIDAEGQDYSVNLSLNYSGLQNLEQINETYSLSTNFEGSSVSYNIENKVNFATENIQIEDFSNDEYYDLSKLNTEKLNQIIQVLVKGILSVNTKKLQEAGLSGTDPINGNSNITSNTVTDTTNTTSTNTATTNTATTNTTSTNQINNTTTTNSTNEVNTNSSSTSDLVSGMEQVTKESFNNRFKQYESENATGSAVKSLLMQVIANNLVDDQRKIEVTGDIKLTGSEVPDTVVATKKYKVKCSMDSDGYVNKVEITENK